MKTPGAWLIRLGLFGYALSAPFSITVSTIGLLISLSGATLLWISGEELPLPDSVGWAVVAYLCVKLVTGVLAYDPVKGLHEFFHNWPWLLVWVMPYVSGDSRLRSRLLRVFCISVGVVSLYSVIQNLTGFEIWRDSHLAQSMGRYAALAFFNNQQTWAGFALAAMLYLGGLAGERSKDRWLYVLASILALFGCVASQIRGTLIGLAAGLAVWATTRQKRMRLVWIAVGATGVALVLSPGIVIRFNELKDRSLNPEVDISRPYIWKTAWKIGLARPLLGAGPGNFADAYERTKDRPEARTLGHAHNEWFQEWATSGAPGVLAFTWLLFVVGRALWRFRKSGALPALGAWVGLSAAAFFQCHFSDEVVLMLLMFIALLGLGAGAGSTDNGIEGKVA